MVAKHIGVSSEECKYGSQYLWTREVEVEADNDIGKSLSMILHCCCHGGSSAGAGGTDMSTAPTVETSNVKPSIVEILT